VQPLLVVFEDLHWIDSETQALLDSVVEILPTARVLLPVNYRPEYQHGWGSMTFYTQVRLDPLPPARADELLQALLGADPSLAALIPLLIARTEGIPFFLEESVQTLVETQVLVGERGAYQLAHPLASLQMPATVQAVLAARIDRLPPERVSNAPTSKRFGEAAYDDVVISATPKPTCSTSSPPRRSTWCGWQRGWRGHAGPPPHDQLLRHSQPSRRHV
jgi:hypothetical protein